MTGIIIARDISKIERLIIMGYKPEILAPAGELKSVYGALSAGADAVYLGAPSFSARAFAKNLTIDEICEALDYAHIHGKKIYLTMNTLVKNEELADALELLKPLYIHGLDGIIVQDIGLIKLIHELYPELPIHGSTQLAITSSQGIETLKSMNVTRVVPARELTLQEIKALKATGMEIECFIHGAMCYCYSGKCLFSSIAGGRSGNRGRCAGPCRKEYDTYIDGQKVNSASERYPISMRDMCLIDNICDFIDAGVDSFKIEGRMKAPEYSAGVSAIYREVIDEYMKTGVRPDTRIYKEKLMKLYIRANTSTGYLYEESGRGMISLSSPSYQGISDADKEEISRRFIETRMRVPVSFDVYAYVDSPFIIEGYVNRKDCGYDSDEEIRTSVSGQICQVAEKRALDDETVRKQLSKLGDTFFELKDINLYTDDNSFVVVSAINDVRRQIVASLYELICGRRECMADIDEKLAVVRENCKETSGYKNNDGKLIIGVKTSQQLVAVFNNLSYENYSGIIIGAFSDILAGGNDSMVAALADVKMKGVELFLRLPSVIRENRLGIIKNKINNAKLLIEWDGVYVGGLDAYNLALDYFDSSSIILDEGHYVYNNYSEQVSLELAGGYTSSYEHSGRELYEFNSPASRQMIVYGYIPLMHTANCLLKTFKRCNKNKSSNITIKDEAGRSFLVSCNHELCLNVIYNYLPLNLIGRLDNMKKNGLAGAYRIEFTMESGEETLNIIDSYKAYLGGNEVKTEGSFTSGHYKRGVD